MQISDGFVIVQESANPNKGRFNPRYRGVDRLVTWSEEQFARGFSDPYLSSEYTTADGFIPSLDLAHQAISLFAEFVTPEDLKILYVREALELQKPAFLMQPEPKLLGFDVAGRGSPFYSIVNDFPAPEEAGFVAFRDRLNENGLFDSRSLAIEYLKAYVGRYPEEGDQELVVWEVYLLDSGKT